MLNVKCDVSYLYVYELASLMEAYVQTDYFHKFHGFEFTSKTTEWHCDIKKKNPHFRHNLLINDNNNKLWWNIHEHICFDNSCWLIESNSYTNVYEKQHLHSCLWYSKGKVIYHIKSSSKSHLPWTKHNESSIKALKASIHVHNKLRLRWPIRTYNTSHPADIVSEVNVEHHYRIQHQINS